MSHNDNTHHKDCNRGKNVVSSTGYFFYGK